MKMMYFPFITDCSPGDFIVVNFCGSLLLLRITQSSKTTISSKSLIFNRNNGLPFNKFTRTFSMGARKATNEDIEKYKKAGKLE